MREKQRRTAVDVKTRRSRHTIRLLEASPLIRVAGSRSDLLCHQLPGSCTSNGSVCPASPLSEYSIKRHSLGLVFLASVQQGPGNAHSLVRQGHGRAIVPSPCDQLLYPPYRPVLSRCDDRVHATATARSLWRRRHSTFHRARWRVLRRRGRRVDEERVPSRG
jgi:hypothetical protein